MEVGVGEAGVAEGASEAEGEDWVVAAAGEGVVAEGCAVVVAAVGVVAAGRHRCRCRR